MKSASLVSPSWTGVAESKIPDDGFLFAQLNRFGCPAFAFRASRILAARWLAAAGP